MKQIRYGTNLDTEVDWSLPSVFLAGPTVRGHQPHLKSWRYEAVDLFKSHGFNGNVIIPEFEQQQHTESDKYRYDIPEWEYVGLQRSQAIMFWIPRTRELIGLTTNHEHGYWLALHREKMIYGRPDDAYRMTYLDVMWYADAKRRGWKSVPPIHNKLEKTIIATLEQLNYK